MGIFRPLLLLMFSLFVVCCDAYTFYVGGRDGWVLHPSESYSDWAGRNRFQVNDTLVFKYEKGEDSVLEVSQQDFDQCNLTNPIQKMDTGDSVFKFDRSGPFFFVSGTGDRCKQGQKLIVVVLAVRPKCPVVQPTPPSMSPSTPPSMLPSTPPSMSPSTPPVLSPALAPALSPGPNSPFVQPPATSPVSSPTISPIMSPTGSPAPSPLSMSPPTNSPLTSPPSVSPAPSPFTVSPPVSTPTISPASSPSTQPSTPGTPPTPPSPSGSPTPPSPPGTPSTATPPSTGTPSNPTGSSPGSSDSRVSSVILAAAVLIVNYGIFN